MSDRWQQCCNQDVFEVLNGSESGIAEGEGVLCTLGFAKTANNHGSTWISDKLQ